MSIKIQNGNLDVTTTDGISQSSIRTSPGEVEIGVGDNYNAYEITLGLSSLEILVPKIDITANNINLRGLPTYADNAAAILGGLSNNDVYKTSSGELRIVYVL